jgi:glycosyltransferase involved in cell wall biosynthesis
MGSLFMKRRVLFIIDSLGCGGAEKSLISLLSQLDYSSLEVFLSIVSRGGVFESYIPSNVHLIPFPQPSRFFSYFSNGLFSLLYRVFRKVGVKRHGAELGWIVRRPVYPRFKGEYDVAISYHQGFPTYYVAEKVDADKKIAWINVDLEKAGYRSTFNRPFYDKMSRVCVVSEALYCILPSAGFVEKEKLCIVKDIIDPNLIKVMSKASVKMEHRCGMLTLLTVGRMVPQKNYPLAVETAELLKNSNVDFCWLFVGDGSDRSRIERMIVDYNLEDRVILAGMQLNPYPFFAICDIYVQTSAFEGFGLTLSEAKVFNKPIVTTDFPSAYDQIRDGENGLIASMTAESLVERITSIIWNPSLREHLVKGTEQEYNRTMETESAKVNQLLMSI